MAYKCYLICFWSFCSMCLWGGMSLDSPHPQVSLEWPLESVSYTVRNPNQHELQPPPGGPGTLSLHFLNPQEAQRWAALVRGATVEGQNGQCPGAKMWLAEDCSGREQEEPRPLSPGWGM